MGTIRDTLVVHPGEDVVNNCPELVIKTNLSDFPFVLYVFSNGVGGGA